MSPTSPKQARPARGPEAAASGKRRREHAARKGPAAGAAAAAPSPPATRKVRSAGRAPGGARGARGAPAGTPGAAHDATPAPATAGPQPRGAAAWLAATRPRTLAVGISPVLVGAALAWSAGVFDLLPAVAALVGALLLQVGSNLANDYYDFRKGADTAARVGPRRASASGALAPTAVRNAAFGVLGAATLVGLYLVWVGGWPILAVGVAGLLCAVLYTAGPKPLGYLGLGDLLVFLFFGPVAVMGTVYVQAPERFMASLWLPGLLTGLQMGALATAVLVVNNLRDLPTDRAAGKRTLAVRLGERGSRIEYTLALAGAYLLAVLAVVEHGDWWLGLPLASLPMAVPLLVRVWKRHDDRRALNPALGGTAVLMAAFALMEAVALIAS